MAVLTAAGRKRIKKKNFALPPKGYPIHDKRHAIAALSRVKQHGTSSEIATVNRAVARKYPGLAAGIKKRHPSLFKRAKKGLSRAKKS